MSEEHYNAAGAYVDYGDADALLPVDQLAARVYRGRDAEVALSAVDADAVVVVAPSGLASGYALTQRPLTAVDVDTLAPDTVARVADAAGVDLASYEYVQVGRTTTPAENHSLREFSADD